MHAYPLKTRVPLSGEPDEALGCFYTALDMRLRLLNNRESAPVQDVLLCIGIVHHQLANFREALEIYNEVIRTRTKSLGANHPDTKHAMELLRAVRHVNNIARRAAREIGNCYQESRSASLDTAN